MNVGRIYSEGCTIFGVLFPLLFLLALAVLSVIAYELLCRAGKVELSGEGKALVANTTEGLCTLAVLTGSLQTIISLCLVGFSLWFGSLQVGAKAFAILIQGFASTGFGITVSILGTAYLNLFHRKEEVNESD